MIGWYVHDHGTGHRRRLEAVAPHLGEAVTGLGSGPPAEGVDWLALPTDASPGLGGSAAAADATASGALHWAPLGEPGLLGRALALATWVRTSGCRLLVVDVSVEMLLLGRLLGLPTVAVLQPGVRRDRAHTLGYDTARALLAPWPRSAHGRVPARWAAKTTWTGAFSRADALTTDTAGVRCTRVAPATRCVALVCGSGGHSVRAANVLEAAAATPGWHWHVAGQVAGLTPDGPVGGAAQVHGVLADVWPLLRHADVVVGPPGGGLVAEVAAARTPFLALPQERPFDEQRDMARRLRRAGLAEVAWSWPAPRAWVRRLERLGEGAPDFSAWSDGCGAQRAARMIDDLAATAHAGRVLVP